ncbi:guanine deaminase [Lentilactobacillus senioris]|uniref:guanine deaminase n=1 Tax=Lentilactobacillus senioris TaxID=931534 RepID=UPI00228144DD|nr:guanine deaminase [Lentilactobacillus senioris]MCY9807382.1 guanine deaminase [Lentilactobacillus senioris]
MYSQVIAGTYFTSKDDQTVQVGENTLICIDEQGQIVRIISDREPEFHSVRQTAADQNNLLQLAANERLLPGFVDLHIHAPQWAQAGLALDRSLNDWLNTYTFPLEAKFADDQFALTVYSSLVQTLLANGTTTALMFGTIYNSSNLILAQQAAKFGLRALIGKVAMDDPTQTPEYYRDESATEALKATREFIESMLKLQQQTRTTLMPVITPRFIPSCTNELLQGLGELAKQYDLPIQSHCSESDWEDQYVQERFGQRDAEVFDHFGLLTDQAVMAHGTQLTDGDLSLFRQRQAAVAHCPISNVYFGNAVFPTRKALQAGNQIGLGSDISGGFSPSLYRNMQQAVMSSQLLTDGVNNEMDSTKRGVPDSRISMKTAFYLATKGGAQALNLPVGAIEVGKQADFQVVKLTPALTAESIDDEFERLLYQAERNSISWVMVGGEMVYQNQEGHR